MDVITICYKQDAPLGLGYSRCILVLQTGRPSGARVFQMHSRSTNRSPLRGSGIPDAFSFYKQVAPTELRNGCHNYLLQTGRPSGARVFPMHSRSTNRSPLRGSWIVQMPLSYKQFAAMRLRNHSYVIVLLILRYW